MMKRLLVLVVSFVAGLVGFVALGAVVDSQFVLADLGIPVPLPTRITASLDSVWGMLTSPVVMPIFAVALLLGFAGAGLWVRYLAFVPRVVVFSGAGFVAVLTTLLLLEAALGLWAIASTRMPVGLLAYSAMGFAGGYIFITCYDFFLRQK